MQVDSYNEQNLEYALRHRLFVKSYDYYRKYAVRKYLLDLQLKATIVENGILLPPIRFEANGAFYGGVFDRNFRFVGGHLKKTDINYRNGGTVSVAYTPKEFVALQEEVIYGGVLMGHFGHFITECMARFWYFIQNPQEKRRVVFFVHWGVMWHGLTDWIKKFFQLAGIDINRVLIIDKPTICKKIIVPDQSLYPEDGYLAINLSTYDHIIKSAQLSVVESAPSDLSTVNASLESALVAQITPPPPIV